jgi:hypothetical protein
MTKRTLVAVLGTLAAMFCVGALGYWVIGQMEQQAILFEADTLQKLTYCAQINSNQAEGYARTLLALQTDDPEKRNRYLAESKEFEHKNDASIEMYRDSLTDSQSDSLRILDALVVLRERYQESHDRIFSLLARNQPEAALKLANSTLWPAYQVYTEKGDVLLAHDVAIGRERAQEMRQLAMKVKFVSATLCILVFLIGLVTPFLFIAGVVNWMDHSTTADRGY